MSSFIEDMAKEMTGLYKMGIAINFKNNEQDMAIKDTPVAYKPKQPAPEYKGG